MKKQINPNIKAHLIRSSFYMLLLLAVCAIPFALAQRNTIKHSAARPTGAVRATVGQAGTDPSLLPYDSRPYRPVSMGGGACTPAPWQPAADMPIDLYGAGGASDGTFFYAAGGYSFSVPGTVAAFNRYDPVANTWTSLPDMPQSASMPVAVYYPTTNKIYVFGGEDGDTGVNYNITRIYDIATNTWSTGANMPDVRSFAAGGYSSDTGMIYILSGYNTGTVDSAQPTTWQYDPATDTWTDLTGTAPYPHPAGGFAYGVVNGKLYTAGGRDATNVVINDTWEFDPSVPAYTAKTDEPGTFQNNVPGSAAASNLLWVFGGGNPFAAGSPSKAASHLTKASFDVTELAFPYRFSESGKHLSRPDTDNSGRFYDPATDTWTASPNMNSVRSFPSGAAIGTSLIIASGGFDGASTVASAETENVCGGGPTPTPTATPSCTPIVINGSIDAGDPTQTDRLFRDLIPSTCAAPKVCPGPFGDGQQHHYDSYAFANTSGSTQCINVDINTACTLTNSIFATAYLDSFDPTNLCTNYLADEGGSPNPTQPFSFNLDDGQTLVIVVTEITADAGCSAYTVSITGLCPQGTPTPTPTATATATTTATATPTSTPTPGRPPTPRPRPTPFPRPTP
jgi:N-acetylneuraminic acid mutarotase